MAENTITCPVVMEDHEPCGGEIIIEWDNPRSDRATGKRFCYYCDKYEEQIDLTQPCTMDNSLEEYTSDEMRQMKHHMQDEYEEHYDFVLVSYKTYCWHALTKEQAMESLQSEWAAGEERAYEVRMGL